jgi:hypothetical protein
MMRRAVDEAGASAIITVAVSPGMPGVVLNHAQVTATTSDANPFNNTSTTATAVRKAYRSYWPFNFR